TQRWLPSGRLLIAVGLAGSSGIYARVSSIPITATTPACCRRVPQGSCFRSSMPVTKRLKRLRSKISAWIGCRLQSMMLLDGAVSETVSADAREGSTRRDRQSQSWGSDRELSVLPSAARANTNVMLRARDAQKLALAKREVEEMLDRAASTIKYRVILALSRRKQAFESPRERQSSQALVSNADHLLLHFSNFSPKAALS